MSDLSSTPMEEISRNLFRVMRRIVPDKQDYSFVEKVQLPEDQVIGLCNKLAPSSASASSGVPIDFTKLDQRSLPAVGFYGDKNMMIRIFRKESLVDDSVLDEMERGILEPGFYVSVLPGKALAVVFYWHEGEAQLKKASRKDLSCNFIRYLVELCDSVYVCVEKGYSCEALAASAESTRSKTKRTKRIQGSSVKNSENDVEILSSYDVGISDEKSSADNYKGTAMFCEGYHDQHCCFLTTEKRDPMKSTKEEELSFAEASVFGKKLERWSEASNVDYSRLSNEQFIDLLEICRPQEFENYTQLKNSAQSEEFERCFLNVLPEFCPHVVRFDGGESSERSKVEALDRLKQLHEELSAIFAGKEYRTLLLLGSDFKFSEHVLTVGCDQIRLSQEKLDSPFILYGQEVDAKCSSNCSCSEKIQGNAKFMKPENSKEVFPLSGEVVKIVFFPVTTTAASSSENEIEGNIDLDSASYSAIHSWVADMVPTELRNLELNVLFYAFLLAYRYSCEAQTFIQKDWATQHWQLWPALFQKFCSDRSAKLEQHLETILSNENLKTKICSVYNDKKCKFLEKIKELWSNRFAKYSLNKLVQDFKKKVSVFKEGNLVTRYLENVGRQNGQSSELKVAVSIVEEHPVNIVYKVCELKEEISEASSSSEPSSVLTWRESAELVNIDPQNERLHKVVILKSRELIVFVHRFRDSSLYVYRRPNFNGAKKNYDMGRPVHVFRRGFDLVAVDEATRSIALYEKEKSKILVYKFDESFSNVYWSRLEVNLESLNVMSNIIVWMHFIPGKMELLLVDDTNRARVAEIHEETMMKSKHISLASQKHSVRACVSDDGHFFLIFRQFMQSQTDDMDINAFPESVVVDVYVLGNIMSYLKTIPLCAGERRLSDFEQIGAKFISLGSQTLLLLYVPGIIFSHVLKCSVGQIKAPEDETQIDVSCRYLGYIYHIFDKFATSPKLYPDAKKRMTFNVVVESSNSTEVCIKSYSQALIDELKVGKDKDFSSMEIKFEVNSVENCTISAPTGQQTKVKMGTWIRKLLCLVPVQIARVENNAMVALKDGLEMPSDVSYESSEALSESTRFGFYDIVLSKWKGKTKVISSMGKQSSGKSYLLNHLSGSLFDVAGGRGSDGVWMTVVITGDQDGDGSGGSNCLYVLLDFEGLGSLERSEKEDMLLALLNASVTNITIFNTKDFHLDKDTESAFSWFQRGIKQEKQLYRGLLYIAIKDVGKCNCDAENQIQEFYDKISKLSQGEVEISAMAPYNKSYKERLTELAETVAKRLGFCYDSGITFLENLKLIIAQITFKESITVLHPPIRELARI